MIKNNALFKFLKLFILVSLLVVATFCICFFIAAHPKLIPTWGLRIVDISHAPYKLIIRQWNKSKIIERHDMEFICINVRGEMGGLGYDSSDDRTYTVRIKIKNRGFVNVTKRYSDYESTKLDTRAEAGNELKRIADIYGLPTGACN